MSGKGSRPRPYSIDLKTFDSNWDRIFRKTTDQLSELDRLDQDLATVEEDEAWRALEMRQNYMNTETQTKKQGTCGCGRSPTGDCIGWHALSEDAYAERKEQYETGRVDLQGKEVK